MKNKRLISGWVMWSLIAMGGVTGLQADDRPVVKKKLAVLDFEDKTQGQHGRWHAVGRGMADMLVTALVKSGKFTVIEREQLEKVLKEQKLALSGLTTPSSMSKAGQLLGIGFIVTGSISEFGVKDSKMEVGGLGAFGLGGGGGIKTNTAKVAADIRLINTTTGVVEKAETGEGEESSSGLSVDVYGGPNMDFGKDGFDETVIGKATRKSVNQLVEKLVEATKHVKWQGRIIKVDGKKIYINSGKLDGQKEGLTYSLYRKGEELTDPDTGESLGAEMQKIGKVKITSLQDKFSIANLEEGQGITKDDLVQEDE